MTYPLLAPPFKLAIALSFVFMLEGYITPAAQAQVLAAETSLKPDTSTAQPSAIDQPNDPALLSIPATVSTSSKLTPTETAELKVPVSQFEITGSTVFTPADFEPITAPFQNRELTFSEVLEVRSAITKLYNQHGYITTGAMISPQNVKNGVVEIQVIEGQLADIEIQGNTRLSQKFLRDRIAEGAGTPLNVTRLLENLQTLRLDPRVKQISADLQSSIQPGSNILRVTVEEADTFNVTGSFDNDRSPSVGSFRRKIELNEANLLGNGDALRLGYSNTSGSNGLDLSYNLPINAKNGALWFNYSGSRNHVIEAPFSSLDILSKSRSYEFGFRQPLINKTTQELALGLSFSRQESQTELGLDNIGPFPLSPGADIEGKTKISALRFFQEYTQRSSQSAFAARSQFTLGTNWFGATENVNAPDSQFFAWRGQAQWLKQLAPESLFVLKGDVQLASESLVPLEQFGLGGATTVRGYRRDAILSDSGALLSAELRLPILRSRQQNNVLQIAPFLDFGTAWNTERRLAGSNTLLSTGFGLIWRQGDRFSARVDWGIPLTNVSGERRSLQENGIYFSMQYAAF
ncbi:ShlB/FhaC/HecB family hemolysin secretion/activation protein [filamentous cyanobacterium LEGE 11480]|uniref:ShlB/FhaC/HecB family hemolysin secretion/activation protein n=1 Tax=Romeriopsis navalis LEGE 11480 TaxID=2777977 RepID=A0A928VS23_9CYAN|nr:ShlB/FhaC/HecB family hemolysin secretion/activation protein [Romeriopsis navalis]MBE9033450.1 ShlB/FhaC/HecB family hemolysin secretion/activation protein [Romeriopsis navalis LEGE 11480]